MPPLHFDFVKILLLTVHGATFTIYYAQGMAWIYIFNSKHQLKSCCKFFGFLFFSFLFLHFAKCQSVPYSLTLLKVSHHHLDKCYLQEGKRNISLFLYSKGQWWEGLFKNRPEEFLVIPTVSAVPYNIHLRMQEVLF